LRGVIDINAYLTKDGKVDEALTRRVFKLHLLDKARAEKRPVALVQKAVTNTGTPADRVPF